MKIVTKSGPKIKDPTEHHKGFPPVIYTRYLSLLSIRR